MPSHPPLLHESQHRHSTPPTPHTSPCRNVSPTHLPPKLASHPSTPMETAGNTLNASDAAPCETASARWPPGQAAGARSPPQGVAQPPVLTGVWGAVWAPWCPLWSPDTQRLGPLGHRQEGPLLNWRVGHCCHCQRQRREVLLAAMGAGIWAQGQAPAVCQELRGAV